MMSIPIRLLPGQHVLVHDVGSDTNPEYETATEWLLVEVSDPTDNARIILDWHGRDCTAGTSFEMLARAGGRFEAYAITSDDATVLYMLAKHHARPDSISPLPYRLKAYEITGVPVPPDLPT